MTPDHTHTYDGSLTTLLQQSLGWEYFGGNHRVDCCHQATDWRLLPFLVVVCPHRGAYVSEVQNVGTIKVAADEALLVPSGIRHTVAMPRPGILSYAHIRYTVFNSIDVMRFFDVPYCVRGKIGAEITQATHDLHRTMATEPRPDTAIAHAVTRQRLANQLLQLVLSTATPGGTGSHDLLEISRLGPVFAYIERHLHRPIRRQDLAQRAFLSETRFHYVFKRVVGVAPMEYVMNVRLRRAQLLLAQSTNSITAIGERLGFADVFHFSKTFKQAFSLSPLRYRQQTQPMLASLYTTHTPHS